MSEINFLSLNIERSRHVDKVAQLLKEREPDVACLQEASERDLDFYSTFFGGQRPLYVPMARVTEESREVTEYGVAIFSRLPLVSDTASYYVGDASSLPSADRLDPSTHGLNNYLLISANVAHEGQTYTICTTHFIWTPRGETSDAQRIGMRKLLDILAEKESFVLSGDFNAPRTYQGQPGEIFSLLASHYKDNIPPEYLTSIDVELHRTGRERPHDFDDKMVDGLFTTSEYRATDVRLVPGYSDHMAITATISRA